MKRYFEALTPAQLAQLPTASCVWCSWPMSHHAWPSQGCLGHVTINGQQVLKPMLTSFSPAAASDLRPQRQLRTPWPGEKESKL